MKMFSQCPLREILFPFPSYIEPLSFIFFFWLGEVHCGICVWHSYMSFNMVSIRLTMYAVVEFLKEKSIGPMAKESIDCCPAWWPPYDDQTALSQQFCSALYSHCWYTCRKRKRPYMWKADEDEKDKERKRPSLTYHHLLHIHPLQNWSGIN